MMAWIAEALVAIRGAWELFLGRADGVNYFNTTVEGFWRSFGAMIPALPLTAIWILQQPDFLEAATGGEVDFTISWPARLLAFVLTWALFPLIVGLLAASIGIARTYTRYIIARNWALLLSTAFLTLVSLVFHVDLVGVNVASIASLAAIVVILRFNYLVARHAAEVTPGTAALLTAGDYVLGLVAEAAALSALG